MAKDLGRFRCSVMIGARPSRDQEKEREEEPEGELLCRIMQTGANSWAGHDAKGRSLAIRRAKDGALEIRHQATESGSTGDAMAAWAAASTTENHMPGLAEYQRRLDAYYRR